MEWRCLLVAAVLTVPGLGCEEGSREPENEGQVILLDDEEAGAETAEALPIDPGDGGTVAERLRDVSLAANVKLKLAEETDVDISSIDLQVQDGRVILLGDVASQEIRSRVVGTAQDVDGVKQVVSQLNAPDAPPPAQPQSAPADTTASELNEPLANAQPEQAEAPAAEYYTVRRGDNLGAIARRHGTTAAQLQRLNNISGTTIRAGQRLRVK